MSNLSSKQRANPGECDCCGFITKTLVKFENMDTTIAGGGKTRKDTFYYCDLCCHTPASNYQRYPGQEPSNMVVMQTVCYVGNEILKALRGRS